MRYNLDTMLPERAFQKKLGGYGAATYEGGGKSGGSSTTVNTPSLTQEQKDMIGAQTQFYTGTIAPTYQNAVRGATDIYNQTAGGVNAAAQNYGTVAGQSQQALGETGESALRTGISGLQGLFGNDYVNQQMQAAMAPAQAQYTQNLANQRANFGGAGQLGSARNALADTQLAGMNNAIQQQTAAGVLNNIQNARAGVGTTLAQLGQGGLQQAQAAGANQVTASMTPQQLYNQYSSVIFGTPGGSYSPNFAGTQGGTQTSNNSSWNVGIGGAQGAQGIGAIASMMSDRRAKREITFVGKRGEHKIYTFKYLDSDTTYEGVMAQDLLEYMPEAVTMADDGFYRVDYNLVGFDMKEIV